MVNNRESIGHIADKMRFMKHGWEHICLRKKNINGMYLCYIADL